MLNIYKDELSSYKQKGRGEELKREKKKKKGRRESCFYLLKCTTNLCCS